MVGIQGPQAPGGPAWGAPAPTPSPGAGAGGEKALIAIASVIAVVALVGGSVFVVGQRGEESTNGPDPTTTEPTDDPTDPTEDTTTDPSDGAVLPPPDTYDDYSNITDDDGRITVDIPDEWTDVNTSGIVLADETTSPGIQASTDLDAWREGFDTSGAEFIIFEAGTTLDDLREFYDDGCEEAAPVTDTETDGGLPGEFILFSECGGAGAEEFVYLATYELFNDDVVVVSLSLTIEADFEALERIQRSLIAA